jgi:hypothetical protein
MSQHFSPFQDPGITNTPSNDQDIIVRDWQAEISDTQDFESPMSSVIRENENRL